MLRYFAAFIAALILNIPVIHILVNLELEQGTTLFLSLCSFFVLYAIFKKVFVSSAKVPAGGPDKLTCTECGYGSHITELFQVVDGSQGRAGKVFCPSCRQKATIASSGKMFLAAVIIFVTGTISVALDFIVPAGRVMQWFGAFLLMIPAVTVMHELAHAAGGLLAGARILKIEIGIGGRLFRRMLGECELVVNKVPTGGMCHVHFDSPKGLKRKQFLTILAAPLLHIAVITAILASMPLEAALNPFTGTGFNRIITSPLLLANAMMFVLSLKRHKLAMGGLRVETDGAQLFSIPRITDAEVELRVAAYFSAKGLRFLTSGSIEEARRWYEKGIDRYPDNFVSTGDLGAYHMQKGEYANARELFKSALERFDSGAPDSLKHLRPLLINNLAYATLLAGGEGSMEEADRRSLEAYEAAGWMASVKGTRGAVLVEKGEVDDGLKHLKEAMEEHTEPYLKAYNACSLARAYLKKSDPGTAREYLNKAHGLDPNCPLIASVQKEFDAA